MEVMGVKLTPVVVRRLLGPQGMFGPIRSRHFLDSQLLQTALTVCISYFRLPTLPHHPLHHHPTPSHLPTPLYVSLMILQ